MSLQIDPFFYNSEETVTEITKPFLQKHRLNYFQFARVYADGSTSFLVNNIDFVKERVKHNRGPKSHIEMEQLDKQSYFFLWNGNLPDYDTDLARSIGIDNGLCFVERFPDYYNLIAFAASPIESNIVNFYLNNLGLLKNYICEFKEKARNLIIEADEKRIALPENLQDSNSKKILWNKNKKIIFKYYDINVAISFREWECLKEIAFGSTIKQVAAKLRLSPRTVETYCNRIKDRIGFNTKSELISLFHTHLANL